MFYPSLPRKLLLEILFMRVLITLETLRNGVSTIHCNIKYVSLCHLGMIIVSKYFEICWSVPLWFWKNKCLLHCVKKHFDYILLIFAIFCYGRLYFKSNPKILLNLSALWYTVTLIKNIQVSNNYKLKYLKISTSRIHDAICIIVWLKRLLVLHNCCPWTFIHTQ